MAERRFLKLWCKAALASAALTMTLTVAQPGLAQTTPAAQTPRANTPTPTPTPAPSDNGQIGPPQLRDFSLNGTVTRQAEPGPTPAPRASPPAPPRSAPAGSSTAGSAGSSPILAAPAASTASGSRPDRSTLVVPRAPVAAGPDRAPALDAVTVELPPASLAPPLPAPGFESEPVASEPGAAAPAPVASMAWWPWLLAALAALCAVGFLAWRRQQDRQDRYAYDGVSDLLATHAEPSPEPVAPRVPPSPRAASPAGTPAAAAARADPIPARPSSSAPGTGGVYANVRAPAPDAGGVFARTVSSPPAAPPVATPLPLPAAPSDGVFASMRAARPDGIVATTLRPAISFEVKPIRVQTDAKRGAAVLFDVVIINNGSAPARDVLVEAQLINAGPRQDEEIAAFFQAPDGSGDRLPVIAPMARVSLKIQLSIAGDAMKPIEVEGRQLFVPLVAFNALYRWSGGEEQTSASFLVGRGGGGDGGDGKMAPFRLDQGIKSWSKLDSRLHSQGLQR